jgi:serine/threonine protein kinase
MLHEVTCTLRIQRNVIKAFQAIHARGVCHGDIRYENILVRPDQSVVIVDFELSEIGVDKENLDAEMGQVMELLPPSAK